MVEEPRKYTLAWDLLAAEMGNLSLGKHLSLSHSRVDTIYMWAQRCSA